MGLFDFLFGNKEQPESTRTKEQTKVREHNDSFRFDSIKSISDGNPFEFIFTSMTVLKQYYNRESEEIKSSSSVKILMKRSEKNGEVKITFDNLNELKSSGVLQQNLSFSPSFTYQSQTDGDEFASAEINNSYSAMYSGKEYISLFQITKQKGKIVSFIINNLPGDQDFYYLFILR